MEIKVGVWVIRADTDRRLTYVHVFVVFDDLPKFKVTRHHSYLQRSNETSSGVRSLKHIITKCFVYLKRCLTVFILCLLVRSPVQENTNAAFLNS